MHIVIEPFFEKTGSFSFWATVFRIDVTAFGEGNTWNEYNFTREFPLKKELSFLALTDKKIIGFLIGSAYISFKGKTAHLNRIAVDKDFNHKGIGKKLILQFENAATINKCVSITLEFDIALNVESYYKKSGYFPLNQLDEIKSYVKSKGKEESLEKYTTFKRRIYFKDLTK